LNHTFIEHTNIKKYSTPTKAAQCATDRSNGARRVYFCYYNCNYVVVVVAVVDNSCKTDLTTSVQCKRQLNLRE